MTSDTFISWLIHSDYYLVGGWVLVLAVAGILAFTDVLMNLLGSDDSKLPPIAD